MLLKHEFPEIKGTIDALKNASKNRHNNTLILIKNEFPYIRETLKKYYQMSICIMIQQN